MQNVGTAPRATWDEYFMQIATVVAARSTCLRRNVGSVIVRDKHILATGFNGAPRGLDHCLEVGCLRDQLGIPSGERQELCRGVHAEQNAIIQGALHGVSTDGATLYTTLQPCILCAKMIINAGIKRVVYVEAYPDEYAVQFLTEAEVELTRLAQGPAL